MLLQILIAKFIMLINYKNPLSLIKVEGFFCICNSLLWQDFQVYKHIQTNEL